MALAKIPECLPGHSHHFDIDRANGEISHGVCRHCKMERDFLNTIPQVSRGGSITFYDKEMVKARTAYYNRFLMPVPMKRTDVL